MALSCPAFLQRGESAVNFSVGKAGVILIMCTEFIFVKTKGQLIRLKVVNSKRTESGHGSTRRRIMKWLAFASFEVSLLVIFILPPRVPVTLISDIVVTHT